MATNAILNCGLTPKTDRRDRELFPRIMSIECKDKMLESRQTDLVEIRGNKYDVSVASLCVP